jgi:hypothetical protein
MTAASKRIQYIRCNRVRRSHSALWYNPSMEAQQLTREQVVEDIRRLVRANRARCLWFAPSDYMPETDAERLRALEHIERHGDRATFVRAGELREWLLRTSSDH